MTSELSQRSRRSRLNQAAREPKKCKRVLALYKTGKMSQRAISKRVGVSIAFVNAVVHEYLTDEEYAALRKGNYARCGKTQGRKVRMHPLFLRPWSTQPNPDILADLVAGSP